MVTAKTTYLTIDGMEFENKDDAVAHETKRAKSIKANYEKFLKSDRYRSLVRDHKLDEDGIWLVRSEEFQTIGYVSANLENAIRWAVSQTHWGGYGNGGSIEKLQVATPGDITI